MMGYDRAELKRSVKRSMKGSGCMMVALLFTVVVSAGTWLINTLLGGALTGRLGLSTMISYHIQAGYELEEAVERAQELAEPGDVVILSPASASFDRFKNFEERGNAFKALVNALK